MKLAQLARDNRRVCQCFSRFVCAAVCVCVCVCVVCTVEQEQLDHRNTKTICQSLHLSVKTGTWTQVF